MIASDDRIAPLSDIQARLEAIILDLDTILLATEDTDEFDADHRWDDADTDIDNARDHVRYAVDNVRDALAFEPEA